jgi:archaellum component FlaC
MFWRKNDNSSKNVMDPDSYARILNKLSEIDSRIKSVENDFKLLTTDVQNLRGNFNRKLSGLAKEEKESPPPQTEKFNSYEEVPFG